MKNENLIELIKAVSESNLTSFHWEEDGTKLSMKKEKEKVVTSVMSEVNAPVVMTAAQTVTGQSAPVAAPEAAALTEAVPAEKEITGQVVKSPLVGTFYAAPSEDADPYVSVGTVVKKGQVLAIVEAMKLMNEIESDFDGSIGEILVENGEAVEYGQPLFTIV